MKKTLDTLDNINETIDEMDTSELVTIYNAYARFNQWEEIYSENDMDEYLENNSPTEIVLMVANGDYRISAPYWMFNGYGNIISLDECDVIDIINLDRNDVVAYVAENYTEFEWMFEN